MKSLYSLTDLKTGEVFIKSDVTLEDMKYQVKHLAHCKSDKELQEEKERFEKLLCVKGQDVK